MIWSHENIDGKEQQSGTGCYGPTELIAAQIQSRIYISAAVHLRCKMHLGNSYPNGDAE
jgi:hypothetical protein